jgi:hypothetical protein
MKYIFLFFSFFFFGLSVFAWPWACNIIEGNTAVQTLANCWDWTVGINPRGESNDREWVQKRIQKIASVAISFGALLAVGAIVWAGIQYTKSYGEDEKLKKAKTTAIYALIGLVLLMGSFWLIDVFINFVYTISK